jgi:UDP-N-acetyl-D-mannosaminuronic acid dehydrogenase
VSGEKFERDVCVIGGCGRVGLPLALVLAESGLRVSIFDIDERAVELVRRSRMPFLEEGAQETLERVSEAGDFVVGTAPELTRDCEFLILIIGTPVDEHLNPTFKAIESAIDGCTPHLRSGQTLILRSTIFPGMTEHLHKRMQSLGLEIGVAFCPERVAQGRSLSEIRQLPQIVSACDPETLAKVERLFERFAVERIVMAPMEAELCKLMTNAWRYLQFATVNQFYMIATGNRLDFERILHGCRHNYPRMAGMPGPGLAAGPCLVKDTMQLAAFSQSGFVLGHAAMMVNEGLPSHLVELAKKKIDLAVSTAGILGMAFKADSDDRRDSLSFKLRRLLSIAAARVLCADPYVQDPGLSPVEQVVEESDVLFLATPHHAYRTLVLPPDKVVVDPWGFYS